MSDRAIIGCDLAGAPRRLPGRVVSCASCRVEIFLSDDARQHVGSRHLHWEAMCLACATARNPAQDWKVTPLAQAFGDAIRRQQ